MKIIRVILRFALEHVLFLNGGLPTDVFNYLFCISSYH